MCIHWKHHQDVYYHCHDLADYVGKPGILKCFVPLWDDLHELWEFRNTQRHGKDMEAQESELTCQTILQVTELYNLRHQVKPEDRKLFSPL